MTIDSKDCCFCQFFLNLLSISFSGSSHKAILNRRHLEVLLGFFNGTNDFTNHIVSAFREFLFGDFFVDIFNLLVESVSMLVAWKICIIKCNLTTSDHGDLDAFLFFKPVKHLLESQASLIDCYLIIASVTFWDAFDWSLHDWIKFL